MSHKRKLTETIRESRAKPVTKRRKVDYSSSDNEDEETEQERHQRRLEKKLAKQAKIKKIQRENYFGYSNEDNPFGDSNLTNVFIWNKKFEKQGLEEKQIKSIQKQLIKDKQQILQAEIKKTKLRREQREKDKELEERLHAELAKEMELEENAGWKEKEEEFHQLNAIKRSQLRITQNRWSAIDILALSIIKFKLESKHQHKIQNPVMLIHELSLSDLAQLLQDIDTFMKENLIGTDEKQQMHWKMALCYAQHLFDKKNLIDNYSENEHDKEACNTNNLTISEMNTMDNIEKQQLSKQSYEELVEFLTMCHKMMSGKQHEIGPEYANISVDVNYWTLALRIGKICRAKAFMNKDYNEWKESLRKEKAKQKMDSEMFDQSTNSAYNEAANGDTVTTFCIPELLEHELIDDSDIPMIDASHKMYAVYKEKAIDFEDDWDEIEEERIRVLKRTMKKRQELAANSNKKKVIQRKKVQKNNAIDVERENKMYEREARRNMDEGEHAYNKSEEMIPTELRTTYWWHDKYRPRKPRYFNRVKTGYSWNKYNQTHYDPDNPPPKIVQGYKFNLFYPDLIDPSQPPSYKLYEKDDSEYAILIFHSGPPYQDIAFKIVNNEWEPSHRRGFRCRFEKGIFSLYFNFKRYRYRR
eukprot:18233_1